MFRHLIPALVTIALIAAVSAARAEAASPLVDADWLRDHACDASVAVIDIRDNPRAFDRGHVPCARHLPFSNAGWTAKVDGMAGMLPSAENLGNLLGGAGLRNSDHVVIVGSGRGPGAAAAAARAYWTMKAAGHRAVSLLDGGYEAYRRGTDNPVETGEAPPPAPTTYLVAIDKDVIADADDVAAALERGTPLIDNRESDYFVGINKRPSVARAGTLPEARNLPISWLVAPDGLFHSAEALARIADAAEAEGDGPQINFCNSGRMASLGWFVAHELLGNDEARVYDGSMIEWTADDRRPVQQVVEMP